MAESSSSPSNSTTRPLSLDEEDESVRIAVRALGDMRNSARTSLQTSSGPSSSISTSTSPPLSPHSELTSPDFVSRVSHLPLVNTALWAYEHGKASSRVVKYGAEMMESSVKTISRPVIDRLPVDVNQLDEFACRQLDRIGKYRRPSSADLERMQVDDQNRSRDGTPSSHHEVYKPPFSPPQRDTSSAIPESRTPTPQAQESPDDQTQHQNHQQVVQRSRWQAVLLEAGGIGAAVSEESMRRLKYCLQWLQYATQHIDAQILILRDFIANLQPHSSSASSLSEDSIVSPTHLRTLTDVRRDVVHTIRQVVDVVSKYAGGALPEPARARVRGFILHLPQRWATASTTTTHGMPDGAPGANSAAGAAGGGGRKGRSSRHQHHRERGSGSTHSQGGTPASSRAASPTSSHWAGPVGGRSLTAGAATQAAQRILTLATESLDMMRGVTGVVKDSLDRADTWVERLRVVGLQRQQQQGQQLGDLPPSTSTPSTASSASFSRHRLPPLSPAASTPAYSGTPYSSVPSTPEGLGMNLGLMESSSLSSLCLDGYETPRSSSGAEARVQVRDFSAIDAENARSTRKKHTNKDLSTASTREQMEVDDG
ncbi:transcription factor Opi1-domain-containing protein [Hygrophoropsis aurantiaca]|uniref:Transcription factor Opi1-domain-containing protein n=1 Tax=Hygrophoropsis aurantiaca TaxID=72124 RepID=A0ACB8ANR5_9AGAM|nr:transcription factor Opi1-domain-containing protein [Hygrophoropsis aurantiaca]